MSYTPVGVARTSAVLINGSASALWSRGYLKSSRESVASSIPNAYFAAMVAHDPSKAAMAPNAKFTENTQAVAVGDGLWKTASAAPTRFKIQGGKIHDIEAMGISLPLRSKNGWSEFWR